jgi:hypothetical protein
VTLFFSIVVMFGALQVMWVIMCAGAASDSIPQGLYTKNPASGLAIGAVGLIGLICLVVSG